MDGTVYDMYAASTDVECQLSAKGQLNSHTATGSLSGENELLWPWESNGCSEYGEGVVHIDLVTRGGDLEILECGFSPGTSHSIPDGPSFWGVLKSRPVC